MTSLRELCSAIATDAGALEVADKPFDSFARQVARWRLLEPQAFDALAYELGLRLWRDTPDLRKLYRQPVNRQRVARLAQHVQAA